jgi:hypothetical protein
MTKRHFVSSLKHLFQGEPNFFALATTCNFLTKHRWKKSRDDLVIRSEWGYLMGGQINPVSFNRRDGSSAI